MSKFGIRNENRRKVAAAIMAVVVGLVVWRLAKPLLGTKGFEYIVVGLCALYVIVEGAARWLVGKRERENGP